MTLNINIGLVPLNEGKCRGVMVNEPDGQIQYALEIKCSSKLDRSAEEVVNDRTRSREVMGVMQSYDGDLYDMQGISCACYHVL